MGEGPGDGLDTWVVPGSEGGKASVLEFGGDPLRNHATKDHPRQEIVTQKLRARSAHAGRGE